MKLSTSKFVLLFCVSSLPFSALAQNEYKNNPFIKPSKRVEAKEEKSCDLSVVQELVNQRVAELMPTPQEEQVQVIEIKKGMTNLEIIRAAGAKPVGHVNGTDIYFDETNGVFMYDKKIKTEG